MGDVLAHAPVEVGSCRTTNLRLQAASQQGPARSGHNFPDGPDRTVAQHRESLLKDADESLPRVDATAFRDGMAQVAGAVNIVTTDGPGGKAGLTASAVCSVTDTPPTLLVCVNRGSSAAAAFAANEALCVNTVGPAYQDLAMLFGGKTPMADRFAAADWAPGKSGAPMLDNALVSFDALVARREIVGTHEVIFAEVIGVTRQEGARASVYWSRGFHELSQ